MNQIITRLNLKNRKKKKYFYIQFFLSIFMIFIILIYSLRNNDENVDYENINKQIKINLNINNIYTESEDFFNASS